MFVKFWSETGLKKTIWPVLTVLMVGLMITLACAGMADYWERNSLSREFSRAALLQASSIQETINDDILVMASLQNFFYNSEHVTIAEFSGFVNSMLNPKSGIELLEWAPRIMAADKHDFEAECRRNLTGKYYIYQCDESGNVVAVPERPLYFPVCLVEPLKNNDYKLGFDLFSSEPRRHALLKSLATGRPAVTENIVSKKDIGEHFSLLVFYPVFADHIAGTTAMQQPEGEIKGVLVGIFKMEDIIISSLAKLRRSENEIFGIDIILTDISTAASKPLVYKYCSDGTMQHQRSIPLRNKNNSLERKIRVKIADRLYELNFVASEEFSSYYRHWYSLFILLGGIVVSLSLAAYVYLFARIIGGFKQKNNDLHTELAKIKTIHADLRDELRYKKTLNGLLAIGYRRESIPTILEMFLSRLFTMSGLSENSAVGIYLVDDDERFLTLTAQKNFTAKMQDKSHRVGVGEGFCGLAALSRQAIFTRDIVGIEINDMVPQWCCALPVMINKRLVGVMICYLDYPGNNLILMQRFIKNAARTLAEILSFRLRQEKLAQSQAGIVQQEKMTALGLMAAGIAKEINPPVSTVYNELSLMKKTSSRLLAFLHMIVSAGNDHFNEELRNKVKIESELLKINQLEKDFPRIINDSLECLSRISLLVADLKKVSHVEPVNVEDGNINDSLDSAVNLLLNQLKYNITLKKELGFLPEIPCHPVELEQAFVNILMHQKQSIGDRKGEITIKSWLDGENIRIMFRDNGPGIVPENIKRIFDPFFTSLPVGTSAGLGLSIVYDIIEKHHGKIEVISEPDVKTEFVICFPVVKNLTRTTQET